MRNPFARQPAPTAATLHAQQQIATLSAELRQARATIDTLQSDSTTLRNERDEARREVCVLMQRTGFLRGDYAAERGWDCFKEANDER